MESNEAIRVCVPICMVSSAKALAVAQVASSVADMIEIRLDCLDVAELRDLKVESFLKSEKSIILTLRSPEQGGHQRLSIAERKELWSKWLPNQTYVDIESDLLPFFKTIPNLNWSKVIVSHHDFRGVPADLDQLYEQLAAHPAQIVKIAVKANDVTDCLPIFHLLDRARSENKKVIALAMAAAGVITRILGPSRGSFLTYGALEEDAGTAPGQTTAEELRSVYRIDDINTETIVCGLIGLPVSHSVSPHMHNAAFAGFGLNGVYLPLEVSDVDSFFRRMVRCESRELDWNLRGLSVTAPHKSAVLKYLDEIDNTAQQIGAVNTILIKDGRLLGYNTDADGFLEPLNTRLGTLAGLRVGVIGAGGSARAVLWALLNQKANVALLVRDLLKAGELGRSFGVPVNVLNAASFDDYDVVVNTTPLGSYGNLVEKSPVLSEQLVGIRLVYDLVYNPQETKFLSNARAAGCEVISGLEMLVAQARRQFEIWTGHLPDTSTLLVAAQRALAKSVI